MKPGILAFTLLALVLTGCTRNPADETKKKIEEILEETNNKNEELLKQVITALKEGGQPGHIAVNGIIVQKEGDRLILDERLKIEQIGGMSADHQTRAAVTDTQKVVLSEEVKDVDFSDVLESTTYMNLGCQSLSAEETEGLTEKTNAQEFERMLLLTSKKIFICGPQTFNKSFLWVHLKAAELVLKNAVINIEPDKSEFVTGISLNATKLVLEGHNLIETRGSDAKTAILPGPSISFRLAQEIHGEGNLTLRTIGGNNISELK